MSEDELYRKAEKRVDDKIGFYRHLYSFISVNIIFFVMNLVFSPGEWWFYWITALWGIGLIFHFLRTFVFSRKLDEGTRDRMIEKEMEKMKK
ncbi:MAG: 2TM domain-containing protein [Methanobrevibacter sp.]|uniref:2TM domain-containing protein n=1 Tax=Methanobrevibacter millerae TaxID=230361 RepID=A0A8T3VND3_9EURY|nr:2TM domain-containing protein [Methanobrevibacter millerae]MBE6506251.1 2TM domain-containing protein [Methanobrevibacter millerae]MBR0371200.1 2TM domain-containing protein [Methanobrevibacter sp.]